MALTIFDFETNKNAVIFWYYPGSKKPHGCVVRFYGFNISASVWNHFFTVFKNSINLHKEFPSLHEAKRFILDKVNKSSDLFSSY